MKLQIEVRTEKGVKILELRGHLTMDSETQLFEETGKLVAAGARAVLIDLSSLDYVDSRGLGQMVACHNLLYSQGGELRFVGPSPKVQRLLDMTGLPKVLKVDPQLATGLSKLRRR